MYTLPVFMIAQGNFYPEQSTAFAAYIARYEPMLKEYKSETVLFGGGEPVNGTTCWDMTWVVRFPDANAMRSFLRDSRVMKWREENEKKIYREVYFSFFEGHKPGLA